ncbi:MAG TPA: hypothetical protein RMH26_20190, partial [Polyangiaceae bacterium LLY-WYZ-15_(1-7)]|nr:hypothetical protein [Polyangiaceae bacterium LLY-WYZ-15_(1-7)]
MAGVFRTARVARRHTRVVRLEVRAEGQVGRGECVPYARYGESAEGVARTLRSAPLRLERVRELPAGAARDALDAALLDLEAKLRGVAVHALLGLPAPRPVATAFSVGVDAPA